MGTVVDILSWLQGLPEALVYVLLGVGAALENVFPPVPADTFALLGGFLAARGFGDPWIALACTWFGNVGSALVVYRLGDRYGRSFFRDGWGRHLLNEKQLRRMQAFYDRFGRWAILLTRFLPGLRAVVPAFAGVTHQPFWAVAFPVAFASALWYGSLVGAGYLAGENMDAVVAWFSRANKVLLGVAGVMAGLVVWWWMRTRKDEDEDEADGGDEEEDGA